MSGKKNKEEKKMEKWWANKKHAGIYLSDE
jgi:hypothetical protein